MLPRTSSVSSTKWSEPDRNHSAAEGRFRRLALRATRRYSRRMAFLFLAVVTWIAVWGVIWLAAFVSIPISLAIKRAREDRQKRKPA